MNFEEVVLACFRVLSPKFPGSTERIQNSRSPNEKELLNNSSSFGDRLSYVFNDVSWGQKSR